MADLFPAPPPPREVSTASVTAGRKAALWVAGIMVGVDLAVLVGYAIRIGPDRLPYHAVRLVLTIGLCAFLVRGRVWARWLILILLAIGIWRAAGYVRFVWREGGVAGGTLFTAMLVAYIAAARILLWSKDLRAYIEERDLGPDPRA
jgi:hypothetical protein